jgi:hypothetical protein
MHSTLAPLCFETVCGGRAPALSRWHRVLTGMRDCMWMAQVFIDVTSQNYSSQIARKASLFQGTVPHSWTGRRRCCMSPTVLMRGRMLGPYLMLQRASSTSRT